MSETSVVHEETEEQTLEYSFASKLGAEAFGTFILVFVGVGVALFAAYISAGAVPLTVGIAFALALFAAISAFGHISGGHFNPAVTLALAVVGRAKWADAAFYWIAQVLGAALAGIVLFVVLRSNPIFGDGGPEVKDLFVGASNTFGEAGSLGTWKAPAALLVEVVATAIFVAVILSLTNKRHPQPKSAPVAISLTLGALVMVAVPVTNASLNPARSTASALFGGSAALGDLWLFWVAPLAGALIAALFTLGFTPVKEQVIKASLDAQGPEADADSDAEVDEDVAVQAAAGLAAAPLLAVADADDAADEHSQEDTSPAELPEGAKASNEDGSAPEGFDVKGNADSGLYHLPGSRWYNTTVAEFWFASAEDAEAAGFKKAGARKKN